MFNTNTFIYIGIIVIVFIISVSLLIFAPKSKNYYKEETYPFIEYLHNNNAQLIKDEFYKIKNNDDWITYPDKKNITGKCSIWPMYMFSIESKKRISPVDDLYKIIKHIPDVKSCLFIKFEPKSEIGKSKLWKELSNDTLRCLLVLDSPNDMTKCAMWVNGEVKKIKTNDLIIFDGSKDYSIYNKTKHPLHMLIIDVKRPEKSPKGNSDIEYDNEIHNLINKLIKENIKIK